MAPPRPEVSRVLALWTSLVAATLVEAGSARVQGAVSTQDFCQWETFNASCGQNEVVVMETARYGRMQLGRCVRSDLGYVGCSTDVLDLADSRCSGRQRCSITTPNPEFDKLKPCLEDLKSYFEAGYRCQPVIAASKDLCRSTASSIKVKASEGYLSNAVTMESGCGSLTAPWVLEALPGQRINITLLDFAVMSDQTRSYLGDTGCLRYATIMEDDPKRNHLVCGGEKRERFIYTSMGNRLEVRIHSSPYAPASQPYFLLKFQVYGCADPELPELATYKRSADVASIGCTGSDVTWQLKCKGTQWIGDMGTCAGGRSLQAGKYDFVLGSYKISSSLTIAVIIAISIAIGIIILLTGLFCMRRQKQANERKRMARETELYRELAYSDYNKQMMDSNLNQQHHFQRDHRPPGSHRHHPTTNEYASIRDWPLPPTPQELNGYEKQNGSGGGVYFRSQNSAHYPDSIGSGSENIYQLPEASDGSAEGIQVDCPRYFELDPSNPKSGSGVKGPGVPCGGGVGSSVGTGGMGALGGGYPSTGPGVVMHSQSKEAHYSN